MTMVTFWQKPECAGNARQRALLERSGHAVVVRDLLAEPWTAERLLAFLGDLPVAAWFNRAAPRVKSGEVVPEVLAVHQGLALLLADPLLIRRPLMEREDGSRLVGFEHAAVAAWIGLAEDAEVLGEGCAASQSCPVTEDVA